MSRSSAGRRVRRLPILLIPLLSACDPGATASASPLDGSPTWPPEVIEALAKERAPWHPLLDLTARIRDLRYDRPEDVAVGRFLRRFTQAARRLEQIDTTSLKVVRRGEGWVQVEACLKARPFEDRPEEKALLRLVISDGAWKLEHLELAGRKGP